jgi:hypothetical protein
MYVRLTGDEPGLVEGYINIRTNVTEANAVVPVRVAVSDELGLYFGPEETVDFGALSVTDHAVKHPVHVLSNTNQLLKVVGASIDSYRHSSGESIAAPVGSTLELVLHRVNGVMMPNIFTEIGHLVLMPQRDMAPGLYTGRATVFYKVGERKSELSIPFRFDIVHGSLDFELPLQSVFFLNLNPKKLITQKTVTILNHFDFDVILERVTVPPEHASLLKVRFNLWCFPSDCSASLHTFAELAARRF